METGQMIITGERTVPGIWHENYWFRRHEVVYEHLLPLARDRAVLEAGSGEGYGAQLLAGRAARLDAIDYDAYATDHARRSYPKLSVVRGNLVALPYADTSFDLVVSLQTIEHLWDQDTFLAECVRVLQPGGILVVSTPNTLTFPPGNIYHPKELEPAGLCALVSAHAELETLQGLHHVGHVREWEHLHGSIVDQQIARPYAQWSESLSATVRAVSVNDFELRSGLIEESLDLVAVARAPH